jgi:hypothetical protein
MRFSTRFGRFWGLDCDPHCEPPCEIVVGCRLSITRTEGADRHGDHCHPTAKTIKEKGGDVRPGILRVDG